MNEKALLRPDEESHQAWPPSQVHSSGGTLSSQCSFDFEVIGCASEIGEVVPIDDWAALMRIPDTRRGGILSGSEICRIVGVESKSWEPRRFRDPSTVVEVARRALQASATIPDDVDAVIIITCTPYQVMLDQDAFVLLRALRIPDRVVPLQLGAGCAGLARAAALTAMLRADTVLWITYNLPSCIMYHEAYGPNPIYQSNTAHPLGKLLWASPAIFSDAAAAVVLRRSAHYAGVCLFSRDSLSFGDGPGFIDPLIHYVGGASAQPPGFPGSELNSAYGMHGERVKEYYSKGMLLNYEQLIHYRPGIVEEVSRLYTHQASPALVEDFVAAVNLPPHKVPSNARKLGNLVSPCTVKLLDDDIQNGAVRTGAEVAFLVVGAGPERGVFTTRIANGA